MCLLKWLHARAALHRCFATCGHCSVLAHPGMYAIVYGTKRLKQFLLSNTPEYVATHYARAIRCRSFTVLEVLLHSASQTAHSHKKQRWSPEFLRVRVDQKHVCGTDYASSAAIKVSAQRTIEESRHSYVDFETVLPVSSSERHHQIFGVYIDYANILNLLLSMFSGMRPFLRSLLMTDWLFETEA